MKHITMTAIALSAIAQLLLREVPDADQRARIVAGMAALMSESDGAGLREFAGVME